MKKWVIKITNENKDLLNYERLNSVSEIDTEFFKNYIFNYPSKIKNNYSYLIDFFKQKNIK